MMDLADLSTLDLAFFRDWLLILVATLLLVTVLVQMRVNQLRKEFFRREESKEEEEDAITSQGRVFIAKGQHARLCNFFSQGTANNNGLQVAIDCDLMECSVDADRCAEVQVIVLAEGRTIHVKEFQLAPDLPKEELELLSERRSLALAKVTYELEQDGRWLSLCIIGNNLLMIVRRTCTPNYTWHESRTPSPNYRTTHFQGHH